MAPPTFRAPGRDLGVALQDALALHRQGRLDEAEKLYRRVLKAAPKQFDALQLYGMLKLQRGKAGEAYRLITEALAVEPRSADALSNLGLVHSALKRDAEALASFERALALDPGHIEALNNRGRALTQAGRPAEALASFDNVLRQVPRHLEARVNRGNALVELERFEDAIADYDAVLAVHPAHPGAHFNRGNALKSMARYVEAVAAYDRALAAIPTHVNALNNSGVALVALNRPREALERYARALALDKDYADTHFNQALAFLMLGDFRRGLTEYEWRWRRTGMVPHRRNLGRPLWLGDYPLGRKTILVHAEQGLGDAIHFIRYVPIMASAGAKVVLEVQPELVALLEHMDGVAQVVARGQALPAFDVHCPVASLPLALRTDSTSVPADIPYLTADEARIAKWRSRLADLAPPRIALAWSGSATHANDRNRSMTLAQLEPLLANVDARFVSVQRDVRDVDRALVQRDPRFTHVGEELVDFADTAAIVAVVDLVLCVDTSVGHLGGALGRPTWIMLPFAPDWRWLLDRADSPWYPTVKLFRQASPGDWDGVVARVGAELAARSWSPA